MRQRVTIALATLLKPRIIIGDEPTTALDVVVQRGVVQLLKDVQRKLQNTIILVTHDMGVHANIADRIGIMYAGKIVEEAPTEKIFGEPAHPYTQYLINSLPKFGDKTPRESVPGSPPSLANLPTGCPSTHAARTPKISANRKCRVSHRSKHNHRVACWLVGGGDMEKLLEVENLTKSFTLGSVLSRVKITAVDNISFHIKPAEIFALAGESGCGKTTTARIIMGFEHATAGVIIHSGKKETKNEKVWFTEGIQAIFQDPFGTFNPLRTGRTLLLRDDAELQTGEDKTRSGRPHRPPSCGWSASPTKSWPASIRASSPAGNFSASRLRARCLPTRSSSSPTSRSRWLMPRCACRLSTSSRSCAMNWA
jgi:oligopeptide/dipeptide ABC transporter ATP-binding protein